MTTTPAAPRPSAQFFSLLSLLAVSGALLACAPRQTTPPARDAAAACAPGSTTTSTTTTITTTAPAGDPAHASTPLATPVSSPATTPAAAECATVEDCGTTRLEDGACCPMLCSPRATTKKALQESFKAQCNTLVKCAQPLCLPPRFQQRLACEAGKCVMQVVGRVEREQ